MLVLYHAPTAVCAAKVRLVLAEKGLDYVGHMLNLGAGDQFKPEYLKLNPNAVVPTLVHDGNLLIESTVINEYVEDRFPDVPLRPADAAGRAHMRLWTKKEDLIHDAINTMTATIVFRQELLQKPQHEREARYSKIPDPAKRRKWEKMMSEGFESEIVSEALVRLQRHFALMERSLGASAWLAGGQFSLADAGLLSFFYRLELLGCQALWQSQCPRVTEWYDRSAGRPSFATAIKAFVLPQDIDRYRTFAQAAAVETERRLRSVADTAS
jgi:glutathione S-transferase